jgi:hypothetical protein
MSEEERKMERHEIVIRYAESNDYLSLKEYDKDIHTKIPYSVTNARSMRRFTAPEPPVNAAMR